MILYPRKSKSRQQHPKVAGEIQRLAIIYACVDEEGKVQHEFYDEKKEEDYFFLTGSIAPTTRL
jgi:hypothetical protein